MAEKNKHDRELIDTGTDKRYVRRDDRGRFDESDDVGRSLSQDRRRKAKTVVKAGQGDKGDQGDQGEGEGCSGCAHGGHPVAEIPRSKGRPVICRCVCDAGSVLCPP